MQGAAYRVASAASGQQGAGSGERGEPPSQRRDRAGTGIPADWTVATARPPMGSGTRLADCWCYLAGSPTTRLTRVPDGILAPSSTWLRIASCSTVIGDG